MTIAKKRELIDRLVWAISYNTGGTVSENKRTRLDVSLAGHIAAVEALEIAPRFARDIERKNNAIESANRALARWRANQL